MNRETLRALAKQWAEVDSDENFAAVLNGMFDLPLDEWPAQAGAMSVATFDWDATAIATTIDAERR
jgi:hypothetical protein